MSNIKNLQSRKIAILGLGLENLALVRYLLKHKIGAEITICDARKDVKMKLKGFWIPASAGMTKGGAGMTKLYWQLGKNYNKNLEKFEVLFRSPGWPVTPLAPLVRRVTSPMKLFFELCPTKNIIGVTGTKGKGTTASLIYEILKAAGKRVWLGGNIGTAPFEFIDKIKKNDWVVLELSSFQLEDMTTSPHIAVITNFYAEHLKPADPNNPNYHKSMADYFKAKANIFRWQKSGDYLITKSQIPIPKQIPNPKSQNTKIIYFGKSKLPSQLIGEHNQENIAAAAEVAKIVGVKPAVIKKAVAKFKGLEHRLEFVKEVKGVKYYDDSFATTPESTIIALKAFDTPIVLLLGGAEKGSDFFHLAKEVKRRVKFVVLLNGQATPRIKRELLTAKFKPENMKLAHNIKQAVKLAKAHASVGDTVLLSTACASFGMFKNYKQRGDLFKAEIKMLK